MDDDPLLQPFALRHLRLKNRVMSTAHEPAYSEDGMPTERYRRYHVEKARGGLALTMTAGSALVAEDSPPAFGNLHAYDDSIVPWIRELVDAVHEHDCAVMIQLTHLGRQDVVEHGRLAARRRPVIGARTRPPLVPQGGGRLGPRPHRRQVRRRGGADAGRRHGRHRARVVRPPPRQLLVPGDEPARRRVRRITRQPCPVRRTGAHGGAGSGSGRRSSSGSAWSSTSSSPVVSRGPTASPSPVASLMPDSSTS